MLLIDILNDINTNEHSMFMFLFGSFSTMFFGLLSLATDYLTMKCRTLYDKRKQEKENKEK